MAHRRVRIAALARPISTPIARLWASPFALGSLLRSRPPRGAINAPRTDPRLAITITRNALIYLANRRAIRALFLSNLVRASTRKLAVAVPRRNDGHLVFHLETRARDEKRASGAAASLAGDRLSNGAQIKITFAESGEKWPISLDGVAVVLPP